MAAKRRDSRVGRWLMAAILTVLVGPRAGIAQIKDGVAPTVIVLPKGPGSLQGFGGRYEWMPSPCKGTASYSVTLKLPPGPAGHQPELVLHYDASQGNGLLGQGWSLTLPRIERRTSRGVPTYPDAPRPIQEGSSLGRPDRLIDETGEELVEAADGAVYHRYESAFVRYRRDRLSGGWLVDRPDGDNITLGTDPSCRIEEPGPGRTFAWLIRSWNDPHGHQIVYDYEAPDGPDHQHQRYLRCVEYGAGPKPWAASHLVAFRYEPRPDRIEDACPGFLVRTGWRLAAIDVAVQPTAPIAGRLAGDRNSDGRPDYLVRRYQLSYADPGDGMAARSTLAAITEVGGDGTTALPPTRFRYTAASRAEEVSARGHVLPLDGLPPGSVENPHVGFVDLDADGLPDLLRTEPGIRHGAQLNRGERVEGGRRAVVWGPMGVMGGDPSARDVDLVEKSWAAHLADLNGDGRADLVYRSGVGESYFHPNTGTVGWGRRIAVAAPDLGPPSPYDEAHPSARVADLDGDRQVDRIESIEGGHHYRVWLGRPGGYSGLPRVVAVPTAYDLSDPAARLADLNGDGLIDVARFGSSQLRWTAGLGFGRFGPERVVLLADGLPEGADPDAAQLTDLDGDGLADLVIGPLADGRLWFRPNLATARFGAWRRIVDLPPLRGVTPRWIDVNGNGTIDLVVAGAVEGEALAVDLGEALGTTPRPGLLVGVDAGLGASLTLDYETSTGQAVAASAAGLPWQSRLPFPLWVVAASEIRDRPSQPARVTRYRYRDGYYDVAEREFRGFAEVETRDEGDDDAPTLLTRSHFDTGRDHRALRGKLTRQVTTDDHGGIFSELTKTYQMPPRVLHQGPGGLAVEFTPPVRVEQTLRELGRGQPASLAVDYEYDDAGNRVVEIAHGVVSQPVVDDPIDDDRTVRTEYLVDRHRWRLRLPVRETTEAGAGRIVARARFFYDDPDFAGTNPGTAGVGDLTLIQRWVDPGRDGGFIAAFRARYDRYGNVVESFDPVARVDAADQAGHCRRTRFDADFGRFAVEEQLAVGGGLWLNARADYDFGTGSVIAATDFNGQWTRFGYDPLDRLETITRPGDPAGYPSTEYRYRLAEPSSGGPINWIETRLRDQPPPEADPRGEGPGRLAAYFLSRQFFDGSGRVLLTKTEAEPEPGRTEPRAVLMGAVVPGRRGTVRTYLPHAFSLRTGGTPDDWLGFEEVAAEGWKARFDLDGQASDLGLDAAPATTRLFDALLRETQVRYADGQVRQLRRTPLAVEVFDENRTGKLTPPNLIHHRDGRGRLRRVDEIPWEPGLGAGPTAVTRYRHDPEDRLVQVDDAMGSRKTLTRDGLGRVVQLDDPDSGRLAFEYDDASNLVRQTDAAGRVARFGHDGGNRVRWQHASQPGPGDATSFDPARPVAADNRPEIQYRYDTGPFGLGRLAEIHDATGRTSFDYTDRGRVAREVRSLSRGGATVEYVTGFSFDSLDRLAAILYPDGDRATVAYNPRNLPRAVRLDSVGPIIRDVSYTAAEQVAAIQHGNGVTDRRSYDKRLRLARLSTTGPNPVDPPWLDLAYRYDPASNLESIDDRRPGVSADEDRSRQFRVDGFNRLAEVTARQAGHDGKPGRIAYRHDPAGNLLWQASNLGPTADLGAVRNGDGTSSPAHAPVKVGTSRTLEYDPTGRCVRDGEVRYQWDAHGRLAGIVDPESATTTTYRHDARGNRATAQIDRWPLGKAAGPPRQTTTTYVNDHFEVRSDRGACKNVRLGSRTVAVVSGPAGGPAQVEQLHDDHLGSVALVTDAQGVVVAALDYDPFGVLRRESGRLPDRGFGRAERDPSGLWGFEARSLRPDLGRFLSPDPALLIPTALEAPQALNPYAYAANRPLTHNDPDGRVISIIFTAGMAAYDSYQYAVGNMSGIDYAASMALNGAALVADLGTAGMGGGIAVRAARIALRAHDVYQKGQDALEVAEHLADGDVLGAAGVVAGRYGSRIVHSVGKRVGGSVAKSFGSSSIHNPSGTPAKGGTYKLVDPESGQVMRTGRSKDLKRRESQHNRNPELEDYRFEVDRLTDNYAEQRGREQIIHDKYDPPLDKIRPIRENNPERPEYLKAGKRVE